MIFLSSINLFLSDDDSKEDKPLKGENVKNDEIEVLVDDVSMDIDIEYLIGFSRGNNSKVYAISQNREKVVVMDFDKYNSIVYDYYDGKLYTFFTLGNENSKNSKGVIGYVDLKKDKRNFTKITEFDMKGTAINLVVSNSDIYYMFTGDIVVYKYDVKLNKHIKMDIINLEDKGSILFKKNSDIDSIIYSAYNFLDKINIIGFFDENMTKVTDSFENASLLYLLNDKFIYKKYLDNSKWIYYEYNLTTKKDTKISDTVSFQESSGVSLIVPYNNSYIYFNNNILYQYQNGVSTQIYKFNGNIHSINLLSSNILNVSYYDDANNTFVANHFYLTTKEVVKPSENITYYDFNYIN